MTDSNADIVDGQGPLRTITPHLSPQVMRKLGAYIEIKRDADPQGLASALRQLHERWQDETWSLELRAVALLLADLIEQGWEVTTDEEAMHLQPPGLRLAGESAEVAKGRLRRALQTGRDRQLVDSGVQKFLGRMHHVVPRPQGRTSIADVIENGAELAELLRPISGMPGAEMASGLKRVIDPVIEVCDEDAKCSVTGLRLLDIWRYFRHTWSLEYRSIPGRQLALLIRNAARPKRPVIGIAMLASPVVRMRSRDNWIGWNPDAFLSKVRDGKWEPETALRALVARVEKSITEIRSDDLVSIDELACPSGRTVLRLEQRSAGAAATRQRELEEAFTEAEEANEVVRSQRDLREDSVGFIDWLQASKDALFIRKRSETLGNLLDAKRTFQSMDWSMEGAALLDALLRHPNGWRTLNVALREVRKAGLSSQVADVSVCGAVAPYNALLGGKLVALLMTAREVREAYRDRYAKQMSLISSKMAGRAIYRPAELKALTTTSLYGNGSSQYNRLKLRAKDYPELERNIEWNELEKGTAGYGTVHLGNTTVNVLRELNERERRARRVNHRFGEGASPRMRQIRESVETLGIDANAILHHATPRVSYVCELHPGALEELMGLRELSENEGSSAAIISSLWRRRWLAGRIQRPDILARIAEVGPQTFEETFASFRTPTSDLPIEESPEAKSQVET